MDNELMLLDNPELRDWDNPYELIEAEPESEILVSEISNPMASDACSIAGDYRAEGMTPSEALTQAWRDVKADEDDDSDDSEFEPNPWLVILAVGGIGLAAYRWRTGHFPWQASQLARQAAVRQAQVIARNAARARAKLGNEGHHSSFVAHQPTTSSGETVNLIFP